MDKVVENNLSKAISQIKFPVRYDEEQARILDSRGYTIALLSMVKNNEFGHTLAEMINGLDGRGNLQEGLIAEMQNIRAQALSKQGRHSGLTEGYIEATACIDVIDHLLKFAEASKPDRQVKSAEEIFKSHAKKWLMFVNKEQLKNITDAMEIYAQQYK